jgi:serine protease AprX
MKLLAILFLCTITALPQVKHFIYFNDKGMEREEYLTKHPSIESLAKEFLSERSIERRKKNMGENFFTAADLPVNENYIFKIEETGVNIVHRLSWFNAVSAYLTDEQITELKKFPFIKKIEPVKTLKYKKDIYSSDRAGQINKASLLDYGASFTQLELSNIPDVHRRGIDGSGVLIGFLDTGYEWQTHEALSHRDIIAEWDFIFNDNNTANQPGQDPPGHSDHGTYTLSITAGYKEGQLIGAAYNSSFLLAKTEWVPTETHLEEDNYAAALIWMDSLGVDITTSSLGYSTFDDWSYTYGDMDGNTTIVSKAANEAFNRGIVTITSAGNEGNSSWFHITAPADAFNILAVGAVTNANQLATFSSRGPTSDGRIKPEIVAQGVQVFGAYPTNPTGYRFANGTSSSAPIAAGAAGLLLSAHPHLKNTQIRNIFLETSGNAASPNNERGYGLINASNAVTFPNLERINSTSLKLHKIFFNDDGINPATAAIHYNINGTGLTGTNLNSVDSIKYFYSFENLSPNQVISFYFTYNDLNGNLIREPAEPNIYKLNTSGIIVSLNVELVPPYDYGIVSQNFPNPFNYSTTINYFAEAGEHAFINIYNWLGEKVYHENLGTAAAGENAFVWNGRSFNNNTLPSGAYFYVLSINGNHHTKKMMFLK